MFLFHSKKPVLCITKLKLQMDVLTLIIAPFLLSYFLPSNLHLHSHEICFASIFDSFTPLIMLNASRFMSSILLGNNLFGKHWPKHAWSFYIHRYTFYSQCSTLSTSTIKACLMQYIMIFHQIFMNVYNITDIHSLISNRKIMQGSLEPVFFCPL